MRGRGFELAGAAEMRIVVPEFAMDRLAFPDAVPLTRLKYCLR
jgi:hypothetical protein